VCVPDGIFDVEVNATLRRRRVANLVDQAWSLRSNMGKDVARFVRAKQRYPKVRSGVLKSLDLMRTSWQSTVCHAFRYRPGLLCK